jgi:hypothetical protein
MYSNSAEYLPVMPTYKVTTQKSESMKAHLANQYAFSDGTEAFYKARKADGSTTVVDKEKLFQLEQYVF